MSYIQPNTNIYFLQGVPLSKNYRNTVYYNNKESQWQGFSKYVKKTLTKQSYQRSGIGSIKVELTYAELMNCNYMIFENSSFENKKFYAFITGISYISNTVTAVYYQLDVMQTWCYDYEFLYTYVDRQHASSDGIGENIVTEGLDVGREYVIHSRTVHTFPTIYYHILATSFPDGTAYSTVKFEDGILNGLYSYLTSNVNNIISVLDSFIQNGIEDAIVSVYMSAGTGDPNEKGLLYSTVKRINAGDKIGGYTPKNNKLYTSPYCLVTVNNNLGIEQTYKPEVFPIKENGFNMKFNVHVASYPQPIAMCCPVGYGYSFESENERTDYGVTYSVFPTVAFAGDSFKVWWAQNKNTYLATLSNIQTNYDTAVSLAGTNYTIAKANAEASQQQANNTANNQLANARSEYNVTVENAQRTYDSSLKNKIIGGVQNEFNASESRFGTGYGIFNGINNVVTSAVNGVADAMLASSKATQTNTNRSANVALLNTSGSVNTAIANAQIAYDTAIQNAELTQKASELSAATTSQTETASLLAKKQDAEMQPNSAHCLSSNDGLNAKMGLMGFTITIMCPKKEYLENIDNYFTMYGYSQCRAYKPTRLNRKVFSYLKTVGCSLKGNFNQGDMSTIEEIYNNGITTWASLEAVGNYEVTNSTL